MDFKEKSTIAELRALIGQNCLQKTLRGWISAGIVVAVELRDLQIFLIVKDGVRRNHEKHLPLSRCKVEDIQGEQSSSPAELKREKWEERMKEKKDETKEDFTKKLKTLKEAKRREDIISLGDMSGW